MKKVVWILSWVLCGLLAFYPVGTVLTALFGCTLELLSIHAYAVVVALSAICLVVVVMRFKPALEGKIGILLAIVAPLAVINAVFCLFTAGTLFAFICICLSVGCCFFLTVDHGKPLALKRISMILLAIMTIPVAFFSFMMLIFGNLGKDTVVQSVDSPNGKYYAQVIASSQGALGGDTVVQVQNKGEFNALLFKIKKKPQRVYFGDWGEFETLKIYWVDDNHIAVKGKTYEIE